MFIVRRITGNSMLPALKPGLIVVGIKYFKTIRPGNIIIFYHNGIEKIKRVSSINANGIFVLGDNQKASADSRQFGPVARLNVVAKIIRPKYLLPGRRQARLSVKK